MLDCSCEPLAGATSRRVRLGAAGRWTQTPGGRKLNLPCCDSAALQATAGTRRDGEEARRWWWGAAAATAAATAAAADWDVTPGSTNTAGKSEVWFKIHRRPQTCSEK